MQFYFCDDVYVRLLPGHAGHVSHFPYVTGVHHIQLT